MEIIEKKMRLTVTDKFAIVAWANLYRNPESRKIIYGTKKAILNRCRITDTTLDRILKEWDDQDDKNTPDLNPLTYQCGKQSLITDIIKENLIDLHNLTEGNYVTKVNLGTTSMNLGIIYALKQFELTIDC